MTNDEIRMTNDGMGPSTALLPSVIRHSSFGNSSFTRLFLAHSFRLRDPWQRECTAVGATCWSRVFHRPTGLEPDDALWLVCSGLPPGAIVSLNGTRLTSPCATGVPPVRPADGLPTPSTGDTPMPSTGDRPVPPTGDTPVAPQRPNQFDVTALLADANRIELEVPSDSALPTAHCPLPTAFPYDVRLGVVGHS